MHKKEFKILAIETSCDETAASVIGVKNGKPGILSNIVSSQVDLHAKTGGVVPEVASRAHMEAIVPVITEALVKDTKETISTLQKEIDYIAVTAGPGLIGSLLVGFNAAKTITYALDKPIIPVNHIEGHIYSAFAENQDIDFPVLALTVSGGHSSLTLMKNHGEYKTLGETIDDAAGEAFDKVAKLLDLGYPGGPIVSKYAQAFRERSKTNTIIFPRPILRDGTFNFSFSGLKTAVLQKTIELKKDNKGILSQEVKEEICAAFEDAVVDVLVKKTVSAAKKYEPKTVILAGGVAANKYLRENLSDAMEKLSVKLVIPPFNLCGDNAAMIGLAACYHILRNDIRDWTQITVDSSLELK